MTSLTFYGDNVTLPCALNEKSSDDGLDESRRQWNFHIREKIALERRKKSPTFSLLLHRKSNKTKTFIDNLCSAGVFTLVARSRLLFTEGLRWFSLFFSSKAFSTLAAIFIETTSMITAELLFDIYVAFSIENSNPLLSVSHQMLRNQVQLYNFVLVAL